MSKVHDVFYPIRIVKGSQKIAIGRTRYGKVVLLDLRQAPHAKITGLTGSGKSSIMLTILYFLCQQFSPAELQIEIIDLKGGATYAAWINVPHVKGIYASTVEARNVLSDSVKMMWERLDEIRLARAQFRRHKKFPLHVILIDEGGELSPADAIGDEKAHREACMKLLSTLARVGREPNIRIIYGTQRPDANHTLPATIRSQLDNTICFRVREKGDSKIVLGHEGADQLLLNPGRGIFQTGTVEVEFQAIYIPEDSLTAWLKSFAGNTAQVHGACAVAGHRGSSSDWD